VIRQEAGVRGVKANAGLQPQFSKGDHILQVARIDAFVSVIERPGRTPDAACLIQGKLRQVGQHGLRNFVVAGSRSVSPSVDRKSVVVISGIGKAAQN
jgi:hypothetical protein